ncbi:uncharacterized protein C8Q71DRAFT_908297 [Rhodofomes roseus]|uniref:RRM domain-containing protein n=1 Tax=Rhodofomes roseus TaxID=34475 RepID=A0ABQ8KE71_9APHY|nr:uncharacterized protein C8Q71DRAFT_908297 [Rhodofomes roseus]KAH9835913.1 hypothetical protein C8Q71DRAFT_908297 [Rhodofomes roseus]
MHSKPPLRERAWGTRYDSLGPSPPTSPQKRAFPTPVSTPVSRPASAEITSASTPDQEPATPQTRFVHPQPEKIPHDANVFVGSLPSTVDIPELTRLLREHLSQHTEVKSVKVVRDPHKNGTCAFVQCQDAAAAARLMETLRTLPPRPFLGRILRYEPARATRALLISYRLPTKRIDVPSHDLSKQLVEDGTDDALPKAMRIYQASSSKFLEIVYDDEARHYKATMPHKADNTETSPFSGGGVLISPLQFDLENIRQLVVSFGAIERFATHVPLASGHNQGAGLVGTQPSFPRPHNGPRSASMDQNVWEVKWEHRDDCVNALMTLRRVAFLNISWAHHADPPFVRNTYPRSPSPSLNPHTRLSYVSRVQSQLQSFEGPTPTPHRELSAESSYCQADASRQARTRTYTISSADGTLPPTRPWSAARTPSHRPDPDAFVQMSGSYNNHDDLAYPENLKWSDSDFPPLDIRETGGRVRRRAESSRSSWTATRLPPRGHGSSSSPAITASPASSLAVNPSSTPARSRAHSGVPIDASPLSCSDSAAMKEPGLKCAADVGAITSPDRYPTTRTPRSGRVPILSSVHDGEAASMHSTGNGEDRQHNFERMSTPGRPSLASHNHDWSADDKPHVDPTTIFVGGLDVYNDDAWDETHLRAIFATYGRIENIHIVRPPSKKSAFAFIKFTETGAAATAVQEEHNRVHYGRQIRVQLRDHNPRQRTSPWRQPLSRGSSTPGLNPSPLRASGWQEMPPVRDGTSARSPASKSSAGFVFQQPSGPSLTTHAVLASPARQSTGSEQFPQMGSRADERSSESFASSLSSTTTRVTLSTPAPAYDQQWRQTAATPSTSVSSVGPSASIAGAVQPFALPSVGYFAPPWVHAYPPPYPYPVPFMPIPAYTAAMPVAPSHSQQPQHGVSDVSSSTVSQHVWSTANDAQRPMIPYMSYPTVPQHNEHASTHSTQPHPSHANQQPPLRPTGFIQGQHGMLIPVYQPEALHQYMSSTEQNQPPGHGTTHPPHASTWPQHTQYPFVPYSNSMQHTEPSHTQNSQPYLQKAWTPSPASHDMSTQGASSYHRGPLFLPPAASLSSMPSFDGGYPVPFPAMRHMHRNAGVPSPRRHHRRDHAYGSPFPHQRTFR